MTNEVFGHETAEDKLRAEFRELVDRRGDSPEGIAHRLNMPLAEVLRHYGSPDRRVGLDGWAACIVRPDDAHHERNILALVEKGRHERDMGRLNSPAAVLALMVDAIGLGGVHTLVAAAMRLTENMDATATALHLPRAAVKGVTWGSWPTSEIMPTLQ